MVNPRYAGVDRTEPALRRDRRGRTAGARPAGSDVAASAAGRIKMHSGADIVITAATGVYQSQAQMLDLFGEVTLVHQNGTRFVTESARVDAANNTAEGSDPVEGHGPSGDVKAQGFQILDKGDTILFTGRSDLLLKGSKPVPTKNAPAGLPGRRIGGGGGAGRGEAGTRNGACATGGGDGRGQAGGSAMRSRPAASQRHRSSRRSKELTPADDDPVVQAGFALAALARCWPCAARRGAAPRTRPTTTSRSRSRPIPGSSGSRTRALHRPRQRRRDPRHQRGPRRHADRALPRSQGQADERRPAATPRSTGSRPRATSR